MPIDIILFAIISGFVLYRLYNVLGSNDGGDVPPSLKKYMERVKEAEEQQQREEENVAAKATLNPVNEVIADIDQDLENADLKEQIKEVKRMDPSFTLSNFVSGAKMAFEMVVVAFKNGDKETLKRLLSDELYKEFEKEIGNRKRRKKIEENTLVSIESADVEKVELTKAKARITVTIQSQQIQVVKDKDGEVIEGDVRYPEEVEDSWVFERTLTSPNPNWTIIDV